MVVGKLFKEASPDLKDTVRALLDPQVREYITVAIIARPDTPEGDDLQCRVRCSSNGARALAGEVLQRLREEWGEAALLSVLRKAIQDGSPNLIDRLFDAVADKKEAEF